MSNYTLNNVRRFITHIDENQYWDLHLNEDCPRSIDMYPICLEAVIDTTDPACIEGDELRSLWDYFYEGGCSKGLRLENIGYTGVDNGLIHYRKDRITNKQFYEIYTKSVYGIPSGDTRLHLHKVVGNTMQYEYPTSINEDGSIKLNGGFYQGFFRSGDDYAVLPSRLNAGDEWNLYFDLRKMDYEPESDKTLNDKYPGNKGIFFYMGTRAENKWIYLYDGLVISGTPFGECVVEFSDCIFDLLQDKNALTDCLVEDDMFDLVQPEEVLSGKTYETTSGFDISSPNDAYILSDNKFLLFDRTSTGETVTTYEGDEKVLLSFKTRQFDGNLFLYMNWTPSGYTVNDIGLLEASGGSLTYDDKVFYEDIYNNALAFIINDDGSVGYRMLVRDCEGTDEKPYKILSGNSYPGMVKEGEWTNLHVRMIGYGDGMKLMFYVNDRLKYITSKLPMVDFKMLDELPDKQEGVAYNISLGGGTQGLAETIMPDYMLLPSKVFPLEENFAGTFIGDLKGFKFYSC